MGDVPSDISKTRGSIHAKSGDLTIEADETGYELLKKPRGRVMRLTPASGDECSEHVATAAPFTNLQRAVETAKRLGWLPQDATIESLEYFSSLSFR